MRYGWEVAHHIGSLDVGHCVVVLDSVV
ncbi:MAG: hypothetical protein AB7V39_10585, partial [Nitrospiraceae bacterium]